jgi:succinoglycan biosynthesis transport protein ExoP
MSRSLRPIPPVEPRLQGALAPVHVREDRAYSREESEGEPLDMQILMAALRYWWKLATPTALALAAIAAVTIACFAKPRYTASAWLIIREKAEYLLNPQVMEDPRKFVQNQMELMRSPPVIDPVASKPEVFATPELAQDGDAGERLRRQLKIRAMGQSDFFVIEFTSRDPKKAAVVVNEVAKAYLTLQDRDLSRRMEATITQLEKQRADQQQLIERLRDDVQKKTRALTGIDPVASKAMGRHVDIRDTLSVLQQQVVEAEIEQAMAAAQVEAEEEMLKRQTFEVPATEVENRVQALPEIVALKKRIGDAQALIKEHERQSVNLPKNASYQYLLRQKAADEEHLAKRVPELRSSMKTELEKSAEFRRSDAVANLRQSLEAKKLAVSILRERIDKERTEQQSYKGETVELEFLRADYESAARVFEAINSRIVAMRLEQHAPDRVILFKEASPPGFPDEALPYKKMGLGGGAAFLLPFGLAVVFELCHRRVSSRRQLEATCRSPVVAEVASMPRRIGSARARGREAANLELHLFEESVYGLGTHLMLSPHGEQLRILAVTSAISREGKTSVAVQLALSIARATGEPTLLIDGDMRSPDVHRIFEIDRGPGLADVLQGTCSADSAIDTNFSPSLHVLPAGQLGTLPHRLLRAGEFEKLLAELQTKYRYIVLDTPPILPASEALMIARQADVTVVCARRDYSRIDQVREAHSRLTAAGVRVAGTVLNGIPPGHYAYRYGSHYYDRSFPAEMELSTHDAN